MRFPENIKDREKFIFDCVLAGDFTATWTDVEYSMFGHDVKLQVMDDALKIDGVRVNVSAALQQQLADIFDASLMTAQVADLVYTHSLRRIDPTPMQISTTVSSMVTHSSRIDAKLKSLPVAEGLVADPGKHWILDKKIESAPGRACNYGWHFAGTSYMGISGFPVASSVDSIGSNKIKVIQPNATAHDPHHLDYSQICQLVSQACWVDGIEKRFSDLLTDPNLSTLVSHQGPLSFTRQPGVPEIKGQIVLFPVIICQSLPIV